jgi:hypothetical protein
MGTVVDEGDMLKDFSPLNCHEAYKYQQFRDAWNMLTLVGFHLQMVWLRCVKMKVVESVS